MTDPRHDFQSGGPWVAQFTDTEDLESGAAYDYTLATVTNIPGLQAAAYGWQLDEETGLARFVQKPGTVAPVSGLIFFPGGGKSGRTVGQWAWIFAAEITDVGPPIMATPIHDVTGGVANVETGLGPVKVEMLDGSTPTVKQLGTVIAPTDMSGKSTLIFVPMGGGATARIPAQITSVSSGFIYNWVEEDPGTNTVKTGGRTGVAQERNESTIVPITGQPGGPSHVDIDVYLTGGSAGPPVVAPTTVYTFFYPLGTCTP